MLQNKYIFSDCSVKSSTKRDMGQYSIASLTQDTSLKSACLNYNVINYSEE